MITEGYMALIRIEEKLGQLMRYMGCVCNCEECRASYKEGKCSCPIWQCPIHGIKDASKE